MEEVAKYNKKDDVWVVLNGRVLHVSTFLSQHLVGELAIPTSAGKEATAKSDMIHPPAVAEKYAPDAFVGVTGSGKAKKWKGVVRSVPVVADKGDAFASLEEWGDRRMEESQYPGGELAILISAGFYSRA